MFGGTRCPRNSSLYAMNRNCPPPSATRFFKPNPSGNPSPPRPPNVNGKPSSRLGANRHIARSFLCSIPRRRLGYASLPSRNHSVIASSFPTRRRSDLDLASMAMEDGPQSEEAAVPEAIGELATSTAPINDDEDNQVVTPWEVAGGVNYDKLVVKFGCQRIDAALIDRIARLTSRAAHRFLRRGIFFAHRDLNQILDMYERGDKFYLYTGRGPSSESMHFGHLIPFMFTSYLQAAFKVPVVIQLTDDEKFLFKDLSIEETKRLARENAKDIIACGFDIERTFIFSDFRFVGGAFYENMMEVAKRVTVNALRGTFGFTPEDPIGKWFFPVVQAAPSFASSFPHLFGDNDKPRCLIPCAIDQDPYFRMTRDVAPKIGHQKPSLIESIFFPALKGGSGKMSASDQSTAIYLTDEPKVIRQKIDAFSGGQESIELHGKYGANIDDDVCIKYLNFFLEDDSKFELIKEEYKAGNILTGELKNIVADELSKLASAHQRARALVTDEMVDVFMSRRPLPNMFG